jgi:L,D-peptidoglycan transpeptidase YkuD (ErfK/YbiS/YcfS/YnhG family)
MRRPARLALAAVATAAVAGLGSLVAPVSAAGTIGSIDRAATASAPAVPGTSIQATPLPADPTCEPPASVPAGAKQVVLVQASGTYASVDLLQLTGGTWQCARRDMTGRVGRSGVHPLATRIGGDGSTPGGTFPLGTTTAPNGDVFQFFGNGADPGVHGGWHQVQPGDCWEETGGDPTYNMLTSRPQAQCTGDDEYLAASPGAYSRAALIGANMGPGRSGDAPGEVPRAAAIFLHRFSYAADGSTKPTSGCVSLGDDDLDAVLRALVPGEAWFVITA